MSLETKNKPKINVWKIVLACTTWIILNILTVTAILGMGTIDSKDHNTFTDWEWKAWYIFYIPFVYPIFIYGLPIYISGVVPLIIHKIQNRQDVKK